MNVYIAKCVEMRQKCLSSLFNTNTILGKSKVEVILTKFNI